MVFVSALAQAFVRLAIDVGFSVVLCSDFLIVSARHDQKRLKFVSFRTK